MTARRLARRFRLSPTPLLLEDRAVPATFTATIDPSVDDVGAVSQLVQFFDAANGNGDAQNTITLLAGATYSFNVNANEVSPAAPAAGPNRFGAADGGTALPVVQGNQTLQLVGNGATFVRPSGAPSLRFLRAAGYIGGVEVSSPTLVVTGLTFENGNTYDYGVGGNLPTPTLFPDLSGGAVRLDNADFVGVGLRFVNNTSSDNGGAVAVLDQPNSFSHVRFFQSTFSNNYAGKLGGGVSGFNKGTQVGGTVEFTDSTLTDNVSLTGGGAADGQVYEIDFNPARATDTGLPTPTADPGFGLPAVDQGPNLVISNRGTVGGVQASLVDAANTLFARNVGSAGAAAVLATTQVLRLRDSAVVNNQSLTAGAAVGQGQGLAAELVNTTVSGNLGGAPAVVAPTGQVVLAFSTVTNNASQVGDTAGVSVTQNVLTVYASVVANNRVNAPADPLVDVFAPLVRNNGYNFFGVVPSGFQTVSTDKFGRAGAELDPKLAALTDFVGVTLPAADGTTKQAALGLVNSFENLPAVTFGSPLTYGVQPAGTDLPVRYPAAGSPLLGLVRQPPPTPSPLPPATRLALDALGVARPTDLVGSDIGAVQRAGTNLPAAALPGTLIPSPPTVPPPPPPTPTSPPGPVKPPAVFAAGPGAALNPFVPPPPVAADVPNQKADGSPSTPTVAQTVPDLVRLYNADGSVRLTVQPFDTAPPGGVRVAVADFTGDGVPDLVAGTGSGVATQVVIIDGASGAVVTRFSPFEAAFTGGVFVAAGDLTGDGRPELVVTPDDGGGPRVRVYSFAGGTLSQIADFYGIDDPNFRGGARAAVGDLTGDGVGDLIVAAGTGGGPRVAVYSGASLSNGQFTAKPFGDFFAFDPSLRDGVYVAAGDVDGDGRADLIIGAGPGGGPRVLVLSGSELAAGRQTTVADFFAGDPADRDGVTVAVADLDGDAAADVVAGNQATGTVTGYYAKKLTAGSTTADVTVQPFGEFQGGVFVG